jgi:putative membrane protein
MESERRTQSPGGRRVFDEAADATRRTRLANERTYLAWWRTGLTALAVSFAVGKLVPELSTSATGWAYEAVGAGFAVLGMACLAYGLRRQRAVERALDEGLFESPNPTVALILTAAGLALGVAAVLLITIGD